MENPDCGKNKSLICNHILTARKQIGREHFEVTLPAEALNSFPSSPSVHKLQLSFPKAMKKYRATEQQGAPANLEKSKDNQMYLATLPPGQSRGYEKPYSNRI